jgi:hypothetical protein
MFLLRSQFDRRLRQRWIIEAQFQQSRSVLLEPRQELALQGGKVADTLGGDPL